MTNKIDPKYTPILKIINGDTSWFDERNLDIITKIQYTPFALTEKEWEDIYLQVIDDEKFLSFLISQKECPYNIIEKIVDFPTTNNFADKLLKLESLKNKDIEKLLNRQGAPHITEMLQTGIKTGISPYSQIVIEYMIHANKSYDYAELMYSSNTNHIKKLIEENADNEKAMLMIANNRIISKKIRDVAFEHCDWNRVYSKTEQMNKLIYQSIIQTIFDFKKDNEIGFTRQEMYGRLLNKISNHEIPESCLIDLINRSSELPDEESVDLLDCIAKNTDSKLLLRMIWDKNIYKLRSTVANNKMAIEEHKLLMLKEYLKEYTINNPYVVTQITDKMCDIIKTTVLTNEMYDKIINGNFGTQIIEALIRSSFTPMEIFKKMLNKNIGDSTLQERIKISMQCRESGIGYLLDSIRGFTDKFSFEYNAVKKIPINELVNRNYFEYAPHFSGVNIKNDKELDYVLSTIDKMKSNSKTETFTLGFDFYKECLKMYYKKRMMIKNADCIFTMINDEFGKELYNLANFKDVRNAKQNVLKEQVKTLDKITLVKVTNLIKQRCCEFGNDTTHKCSPRDYIQAHLAIEGYADLYNIINEELRERFVDNKKEREENISGLEK